MRTLHCALLAALAGLAGPAAAQDPGPAAGEERPWNRLSREGMAGLTLHGDLWLYHIRTHNAYHLDSNAAFTELTARAGFDLDFPEAEWFAASFRAVAEDVYGRPDSWTAPRREDLGALVDLANFTLQGELGGWRIALTAGLQELSYGDGLLVYDGYSEKRAVWTTAIRSFPAAKLRIEPTAGAAVELFAALVDEDHLSYEGYLGSGAALEGGGRLYGAHGSLASELLGELELGLFFKDERFRRSDNGGLDPDSDTWALSLREVRQAGPLAFTGELVKQRGRTRVVRNALAAGLGRRDRDAWGGHLTVRCALGEGDDPPYVQARSAWFSGDRKGTSRVESFDPFFYGFQEWGSWYLGDMTSYSLTNTNERVLALEAGFSPAAATRLRIMVFRFELDRGMDFSSSRSWSEEVDAILDWNLHDNVFLGAMAGANRPRAAARGYYGDDRVQTELMVWAGISF